MAGHVNTNRQCVDGSEEKVVLSIGSDMIQLSANREDLQRSPLFRVMLESQRSKSTPRKLKLSLVNPALLTAYLHFLRTDQISVLKGITLFDLFVYGEHVLDQRFRNTVLDAIVARVRRDHTNNLLSLPTAESINKMYKVTASDAAARKLMVDIMYHFGEPDYLPDDYCEDFWRDMAFKLGTNTCSVTSARDLVRRRYHQNKISREEGFQSLWEVSMEFYHEQRSGSSAASDKSAGDTEEMAIDLTTSCDDSPPRRSAKRQLAASDRKENTSIKAAKRSRDEDLGSISISTDQHDSVHNKLPARVWSEWDELDSATLTSPKILRRLMAPPFKAMRRSGEPFTARIDKGS